MDLSSAKREEHVPGEYRCVVCGRWVKWEDLCCQAHANGGLDPRQYVELFWDEA